MRLFPACPGAQGLSIRPLSPHLLVLTLGHNMLSEGPCQGRESIQRWARDGCKGGTKEMHARVTGEHDTRQFPQQCSSSGLADVGT